MTSQFLFGHRRNYLGPMPEWLSRLYDMYGARTGAYRDNPVVAIPVKLGGLPPAPCLDVAPEDTEQIEHLVLARRERRDYASGATYVQFVVVYKQSEDVYDRVRSALETWD